MSKATRNVKRWLQKRELVNHRPAAELPQQLKTPNRHIETLSIPQGRDYQVVKVKYQHGWRWEGGLTIHISNRATPAEPT